MRWQEKKVTHGEELVISLSAKQYSKETGGIEFFACVEKGDTVTVLKGDTDSLVNRAYLSVAKAKRMAKGKIAGGLVFHCSGARLLLEKQDRTREMAPKLKQAFRDRPFLLMFHNGEHGCIPGSESFHGNLMLDAIVFGE
jgi:small ligand-binding sensory domain FIST